MKDIEIKIINNPIIRQPVHFSTKTKKSHLS